MVYLLEHYFSVNFHFLNNDQSYNRDFFTIYIIDDGLSFDGIKSIVLLDNISSVLHTIWGQPNKERASLCSDLVELAH